MEDSSSIQTLMWVINGLVFISFFTILAWVIRLRNQHIVAPSKKHPDGRMIMEIWTTAGDRYRYLVAKKPGGYEVDPPKGLRENLRYFYTKSAVGRTKFPQWMPFDFLRVDAQIASWWEHHAVAIDPEIDECPHCGEEVIIATQAIPADLQRMLQARDVIGAGDELLRDSQEHAEALTNLISSLRLMKYLPYVAIIAAVAAIAAAVFGFQVYTSMGAEDVAAGAK